MVRIRLRRQGLKGQPTYRIIVTEGRSKRDGRFIENIGHYNPRIAPAEIVVNGERAKYWLGVGAQPSDTVLRLLVQVGVLPVEMRPNKQVVVATPAPAPAADQAAA